MSLYLGETPIAVNSSSREIGEIIQSTIPLSDAGLHLLDGAVISNVGSYAKFVNYIAGLVSNYPDLFVSESDWQSAVSTYGVCGKFVYDSTNNTVRLPKITGFTEGTTDVTALGDLVEAGLPNITGFTDWWSYGNGTNTPTGAFYTDIYTNNSPNSGTNPAQLLRFDASRSNSIYGNSNTVQPQSIKVLYYIVIASSITNELNLDVADLERSKADKDFSNITSTGTSLASGWSMPSSRSIALTLGASGATYTAPANGYFNFRGMATAAEQYVYIGDANFTNVAFQRSTVGNGDWVVYSIPVAKGNSIIINYTTGANNALYFIKAKGEENV